MSEKILSCPEEKEYGFYMEKRQRLLQKLEKAWLDFRASFSGLSKADLLSPGVVGAWSIKDIIAHITTWEEEALKYLPLALRNQRPPKYATMYGGINAFNARTSAKKRELSLAEILRQSDATHRKLLLFLEGVAEEHLGSETRFRRRLRLDTYSHYAKHTAAVNKWKMKKDE
jgi:hypothetical protein